MLVTLFVSAVQAKAEWHPMPGGMEFHSSCIHQYTEDFHVDVISGVVTMANGSTTTHPPCAFPPRQAIAQEARETSNQPIPPLGYYSDWSVYAQTVYEAGYGMMSNDWTVPVKPTSQGPAPPLIASSVYLFNGLEDGSGHHGNATFILQPVVQYGKSGCLLDPTKFKDWWLTSYLVTAAGRAYCGKNIKVQDGDQVRGVMTLVDAVANQWKVDSTLLSTGETSTVSGTPGGLVDAAYLTLEGMVIYHCNAYPANGKVAFTSNKLASRTMATLPSDWEKEVRHNECSQDAVISADQSVVSLTWDPTK